MKNAVAASIANHRVSGLVQRNVDVTPRTAIPHLRDKTASDNAVTP